jgi:hypothetical protein
MRTIHFQASAVAALAVVGFAAIAGAQEKSTVVLNALEVRQLVARAEPADHDRLRAHFNALADEYAAEAKRHTAMSQSFVGNANRNLGTGMSAHCKQLAALNTQSETTARELAAYHDKLASGAQATRPMDATRFHSGAGAPEPTAKDLNALAAKATTPAEHHALEEYFLTLGKRYSADASEHVRLAQTYRGTRLAPAAVFEDRLAGLARDAAKEANEAAAMHKALATIAR